MPGCVWPWEPGAGDPGSEGQSWGHLLRQRPGQAGEGARLKSSCPGHQLWQGNVVLTWDGTSPQGFPALPSVPPVCSLVEPSDSHVPVPDPGRSAHPGAAAAQCSEAWSLVAWHCLRAPAAGRSGSALRPPQPLWFSLASLQEGSCHRSLTAPVLPLTHQAARQGLTFPCCSRCALPSQWKREVGGRHGRARAEYGPPNLRVSLSSMC